MKSLQIMLIVFMTSNVYAHHIEGHEMPDFMACEKIQTMAVLSKDNFPYWYQPPANTADVQSCYQDLTKFASMATPEMIEQLENEYNGQIRIFNNDKDFAYFMQANGDYKVSAEVEAVQFNSKLTVITPPPQPALLFEGIFQ